MKKTYTAPAVTTNGTVVRQTTSEVSGLGEPISLKNSAGSIGFNL